MILAVIRLDEISENYGGCCAIYGVLQKEPALVCAALFAFAVKTVSKDTVDHDELLYNYSVYRSER